MGLKYTDHSRRPELEDELRTLSRKLDAVEAKVAAPAEPSLPAPDTPTIPDPPTPLPQDLVRSWNYRLDLGMTLSPGQVLQDHFEVASIQALAFTHLELWMALERCDTSGLFFLLSLAVNTGVHRFNAQAGGDIPWTPPGVLPYRRGKGSIYEFTLPDAPITRRIDPTAFIDGQWELGDIAYFPLGLASRSSRGSLLLTRTIANTNTQTHRSVCLRGYLTGRYIEHAQVPVSTWQCPNV